ncbi:hypothetical protein [Ekhidna sp.]|uniref:hypothetical protein n=1 Tax=Ekhidna sp. TaxID=2608089 RepID=UPI003299B8DD
MSSFLFGLIILLTGILGLLVTLTFTIIAIFKRNSKSWKRSGYSLLASSAIIITLILIHEVILFPPNPKTEQLLISAYREAPLGGIWLGVYDDQTWQLGYSSVEITSEGTYQLSGDTLTLIASEGTSVIGDSERTSFIIKPKNLVELKNSGIRSLEIHLNKLEKNGL